MENELKEFYGSYSITKGVYQLLQLEKDLQYEGLSLAAIGLIPVVESDFYSITPPDLIPFARTGGDGIHFGFLTDFNNVSDLKDAPIVCVSPTNDPPIRYLASNFKEFLNLAVSVPYVEMLEQFWSMENENQMTDFVREVTIDIPKDLERNRILIFNRLQQSFEADQVDVLKYLHQVKLERAEKVAISTLDGLGIVGQNNGRSYSFAGDRSCNEEEIERMRYFLNEANTEEKLAFVRDANYWYILTSGYHYAVWNLIVELLQSLDLQDDATRVFSKS